MFLPQLLLYPNPSDPLNGEAAALMMRDRASYEQRVKGSNHFQVSLILTTMLFTWLGIYMKSFFELTIDSNSSNFFSFAEF